MARPQQARRARTFETQRALLATPSWQLIFEASWIAVCRLPSAAVCRRLPLPASAAACRYRLL